MSFGLESVERITSLCNVYFVEMPWGLSEFGSHSMGITKFNFISTTKCH